MNTTAKVTLSSKVPYEITREGIVEVDQVGLNFQADYADDRNKEWAKYTPAISLTMTVLPEVAERFQIGDHITLTFSKEEA